VAPKLAMALSSAMPATAAARFNKVLILYILYFPNISWYDSHNFRFSFRR
jgi:hypothetical protein